jgi:hypothetical protein
MALRGTEITPDQIVGIAITQASSSPLGGISEQSGTVVPGTSSQSGQLLVFKSALPSTYTLPTTTNGVWTTSVLVATGAGPVTLTPPAGTTLNGSTSSMTISSGSGAIIYSDGAGHFQAMLTGSGTSSGSARTPILSSDGTPMVDTASGEWLYPA